MLWEGARKGRQALMMIDQKIKYLQVKAFWGPNHERRHLGGLQYAQELRPSSCRMGASNQALSVFSRGRR